MKFLSFVVLLIFNLDIVHSQTFDPFYLKDKNRSSIERVGDLFQIAIPIAGLGYTYYSAEYSLINRLRNDLRLFS